MALTGWVGIAWGTRSSMEKSLRNCECPVTTSRSCIFARISIEISLVFDHINELNSEPACESIYNNSVAPLGVRLTDRCPRRAAGHGGRRRPCCWRPRRTSSDADLGSGADLVKCCSRRPYCWRPRHRSSEVLRYRQRE